MPSIAPVIRGVLRRSLNLRQNERTQPPCTSCSLGLVRRHVLWPRVGADILICVPLQSCRLMSISLLFPKSKKQDRKGDPPVPHPSPPPAQGSAHCPVRLDGSRTSHSRYQTIPETRPPRRRPSPQQWETSKPSSACQFTAWTCTSSSGRPSPLHRHASSRRPRPRSGRT